MTVLISISNELDSKHEEAFEANFRSWHPFEMSVQFQARRHYVFDTNHRACDQSIVDIVPNLQTLVQVNSLTLPVFHLYLIADIYGSCRFLFTTHLLGL